LAGFLYDLLRSCLQERPRKRNCSGQYREVLRVARGYYPFLTRQTANIVLEIALFGTYRTTLWPAPAVIRRHSPERSHSSYKMNPHLALLPGTPSHSIAQLRHHKLPE